MTPGLETVGTLESLGDQNCPAATHLTKLGYYKEEATYVLAAPIREALSDCDRCGTVDATGADSSTEGEI